MKKLLILLIASIGLLGACQSKPNENENVVNGEETQSNDIKTAEKEKKSENKVTNGQEMASILSDTNWQGTRVYDKNNNDLTKENANFIGLAKYDVKTGRYEFFDAQTGESRGDKGTFFITNDGEKRILSCC